MVRALIDRIMVGRQPWHRPSGGKTNSYGLVLVGTLRSSSQLHWALHHAANLQILRARDYSELTKA